jgi:hypothetical protein
MLILKRSKMKAIPKNKIRKKYLLVFVIFISFILTEISCIVTQPVLGETKKVEHNIIIDTNQLITDVNYLASIDGYRVHNNIKGLNTAANYIQNIFSENNLLLDQDIYAINGNTYKNIIGFYGDTSKPRLVIGAHYDVCGNQAGADDNASGVTGLLEIARLLNKNKPTLDYCIELVAYTLEEPPYFRTQYMGSYVHAKKLHDNNIDIKAMICLEMIGYFSEEEKSQEYPIGILKWMYPKKGDFILLTSNLNSRKAVKKMKKNILKSSDIPVKSMSAPSSVQGIDFSDHLNYWKFDYTAIMVCNTAFYRNKNYHKHTDTPDKLNYKKMKEVIKGVYWHAVNF